MVRAGVNAASGLKQKRSELPLENSITYERELSTLSRTLIANQVDRSAKLEPPGKADQYSRMVECTARQLADLEMLATGAYAPVTTFMGQDDWRSCVESMRLADGTLWPIPITLQLPSNAVPASTNEVRLMSGGCHIATLTVAERFSPDLQREAEKVYATSSRKHPGVAALYEAGDVVVSGPLSFHVLPRSFTGPEYLTPYETRLAIGQRRWRTVVGFQTRNPVHRAHEYLHKVALELFDGLLLHPLVGETKSDDISAEVRMRAYKTLLDNYYPPDRVLLAVYPAAMRYAGPREALLHALSRKNYGCTHFIVGRDHAGVGDFYGTYAAQELFDTLDPDELGIEIIRFEHSFYCTRCEHVASKRTCPHDPSHHLALSGTKVRSLLVDGETLPTQFSRPEVAAILAEEYR